MTFKMQFQNINMEKQEIHERWQVSESRDGQCISGIQHTIEIQSEIKKPFGEKKRHEKIQT